MSKIGGEVGEFYGADGGGEVTFKQDKLGNLKSANNRSWYGEPNSRQKMNTLILDSWTTGIAAGNLVGAAAAASSQFALWNPVGSGFDLEIIEFIVSLTSGTLGIPPLYHGMAPGVPTLAASVGTAYSNYGGALATSVAKWMSSAAGAALTGGTAPVPVKLANIGYSAGTYAALATLAGTPEQVDGKIIVAPGTMWVPLWKAAGTSLLGSYSVTWIEVRK
jgi:hypothetical protein